MASKINSLSALLLLGSNSILLRSFYTPISLKEWRTGNKKVGEYSNDKIINIFCIHANKQNINFYIDFIVSSLFEANKYFNDQEPWKKKDNKDRLNTIVYTSLEMIRKISFMLYPIIPDTIEKALNIFNLKPKDIIFDSIASHNYLKHGNDLKKIDILFKKIEKIDD